MLIGNNIMQARNLRIIKTARDIDSINNAAANGFWPLVKKVVPSKRIYRKYIVFQNSKTGMISTIGDFRMLDHFDFNPMKPEEDNVDKVVIDWTKFYPYHFESPFAAYLIPKDIIVGERVLIEDLIEDYIGVVWNQGDTYRLESCEAIWDGKDLKIQYNPNENQNFIIG